MLIIIVTIIIIILLAIIANCTLNSEIVVEKDGIYSKSFLKKQHINSENIKAAYIVPLYLNYGLFGKAITFSFEKNNNGISIKKHGVYNIYFLNETLSFTNETRHALTNSNYFYGEYRKAIQARTVFTPEVLKHITNSRVCPIYCDKSVYEDLLSMVNKDDIGSVSVYNVTKDRFIFEIK